MSTRQVVEDSGRERFNRLVVPEIDVLYRVALSLTRHATDAEDLVQDTLVRAFRAIDAFDGRFPRAWLLTIMRNANANRHRRRRPVLAAGGDAADHRYDVEDTSVDVEHDALVFSFNGAVRDALDRLPLSMQQTVELVDVAGLTYQEAADAMGVPSGTVMSRLHRARRRVRKHLERAGFDPRSAR